MTPTSTFDSVIHLNGDTADFVLRKRRDRSVLAVQPSTDVLDGFVAKAIADLTREAGEDGFVRKLIEALESEGLTEQVGKATARLNAGGIDRTQRLLLSTTPVYARILAAAMAEPSAKDSTSVAIAAVRRRVDFEDTAGLVDFVLRTLDADSGYRARYATRIVDAVVAARALNIAADVRTAVIVDLAQRELPTAAARVDELVATLIDTRRATMTVERAVENYARSGEIDAVRFTPAVRRSMVAFLRDLGVAFPAAGVDDTNRGRFDEYFALAYNNALRAGDGSNTDPIDAVRQKGALTSWDFSVDTFETVEEQGVVPQNVLAAGALDYVYHLGERLGMFKLADALVLRWASGAFDAEPGKASADLYRYWKLRSERVSGEERAMMYKRILARGDGKMLSGMVENEALPGLWGTLMEKATDFIRRSEENASRDRTVSRQPIFQATKQLQYNLTEYTTGMAHMQITEMYHHLLEAKQVLEHAINYFSTGSRKSLWTVIERASREWFDEAPNISAIRSAAVDGNTVFHWIAEFDASSVTDEQFQTLLESAESWIIAVANDDSDPSLGGEPGADIGDDGDPFDEKDDAHSDWDK